jgi:hypothetical protein
MLPHDAYMCPVCWVAARRFKLQRWALETVRHRILSGFRAVSHTLITYIVQII